MDLGWTPLCLLLCPEKYGKGWFSHNQKSRTTGKQQKGQWLSILYQEKKQQLNKPTKSPLPTNPHQKKKKALLVFLQDFHLYKVSLSELNLGSSLVLFNGDLTCHWNKENTRGLQTMPVLHEAAMLSALYRNTPMLFQPGKDIDLQVF